MINSVLSIPCNTCYGHGIIFIGDNHDYNIEPCECVANANDGLTLDWME